ncbi:uncharacterized protein B0P05DRAFT_547296 [Gilbertella persicaria]|uniref:uncharacterized protein n=1 Tax=Gilbertella persicaria TaxID=101096 RepID=UPI00221ED497|nr:uncharacterized protein B0P05DRAFT_547296 [Gilbertella persicaria]KAI8075382.1 hypothetical protein B0P05DRAFT_547296 [Gilbertella persicaria]
MSNQQTLIQQSFPICPNCQQSCQSSPSLKAFNQVYHDACFVCEDCQIPLKDIKYYLLTRQQKKKLILCETHYLKRTSSSECPLCVTVNQYEFQDQSYCRFHYSLIPETHCAGCDQAILKQFVEHKDLPNQIWHPECYMIYKFWKVKLSLSLPEEQYGLNMDQLIDRQKKMEKTVSRVWTDLSSFEESSANCISDMLLNVAAGAHMEGIRMANQFIMHLEVLFSALDVIKKELESHHQEFACQKDATFICKQMTQFFQLLSAPSETTTQELLQLVTGLAQSLKSLIRIGLSAAIYLEHEFGLVAIPRFLNQLLELEKKRVWIAGRYWFKDPPTPTTTTTTATTQVCLKCQQAILDTDCYQWHNLKWHPACFICQVCSTQLNHLTAHIVDKSPYCASCKSQGDRDIIHITLLTRQIEQLKAYLNQSSKIHSISDKKQDLIMPQVKRQRSLLGMLSTPRPERIASVELNQIKTTEEKKKLDTQHGNLLTRSLRRTFSHSTSSLYHIFDSTATKPEVSHMATLTTSQDFIVRHAAVIAIQPLIVPPFSLDELINLVETKQQIKRTRPASVLWGKLITHIKSSSSMSSLDQHIVKTFGVPLSAVAKRDHDRQLRTHGVTLCDSNYSTLDTCFSDNAMVPQFVKSCISAILQSDMSVEGVFRKNGNIRQLKLLVESIDDRVDTMEPLLSNENAIQLAALLKRYLRELPEPLLTFALYPLFVRCGRMIEPNRKKALHLACCLLPKPNRDTMIMIFACLKWVSCFSETNKMDVANLARVIAPSVLYDKHAEYQQGAQQEEINVIETLIHEIDDFSIIPSDLTILTLNDINQDLSHLSSRYFVHHYSQIVSELHDKKHSPMKKYHFGLPSRKRTSSAHIKQRRTSWIPGLYNNNKKQ